METSALLAYKNTATILVYLAFEKKKKARYNTTVLRARARVCVCVCVPVSFQKLYQLTIFAIICYELYAIEGHPYVVLYISVSWN